MSGLAFLVAHYNSATTPQRPAFQQTKHTNPPALSCSPFASWAQSGNSFNTSCPGSSFHLPQCKSKLFKDAYLNRVLFLYF